MPYLQGILERVYDGAPARPMGDPARRLDDRAAGRGGARARLPAARPAGLHTGSADRGSWRMVGVVEDGGGCGEATSTNLHRPPEPPPTSAGRRSVNGDAPARPGEICRELLAALDASEGRRRRRKRSEEHTSELQSLAYLVCRLLLEKKKK